jgi:hypothetical protein
VPIPAMLRALAWIPSNRGGTVPFLLGLAVAAAQPQWPRGRSGVVSDRQAVRNSCRQCENSQAIVSLSLKNPRF